MNEMTKAMALLAVVAVAIAGASMAMDVSDAADGGDLADLINDSTDGRVELQSGTTYTLDSGLSNLGLTELTIIGNDATVSLGSNASLNASYSDNTTHKLTISDVNFEASDSTAILTLSLYYWDDLNIDTCSFKDVKVFVGKYEGESGLSASVTGCGFSTGISDTGYALTLNAGDLQVSGNTVQGFGRGINMNVSGGSGAILVDGNNISGLTNTEKPVAFQICQDAGDRSPLFQNNTVGSGCIGLSVYNDFSTGGSISLVDNVFTGCVADILYSADDNGGNFQYDTSFTMIGNTFSDGGKESISYAYEIPTDEKGHQYAEVTGDNLATVNGSVKAAVAHTIDGGVTTYYSSLSDAMKAGVEDVYLDADLVYDADAETIEIDLADSSVQIRVLYFMGHSIEYGGDEPLFKLSNGYYFIRDTPSGASDDVGSVTATGAASVFELGSGSHPDIHNLTFTSSTAPIFSVADGSDDVKLTILSGTYIGDVFDESASMAYIMGGTYSREWVGYCAMGYAFEFDENDGMYHVIDGIPYMLFLYMDGTETYVNAIQSPDGRYYVPAEMLPELSNGGLYEGAEGKAWLIVPTGNGILSTGAEDIYLPDDYYNGNYIREVYYTGSELEAISGTGSVEVSATVAGNVLVSGLIKVDADGTFDFRSIIDNDGARPFTVTGSGTYVLILYEMVETSSFFVHVFDVEVTVTQGINISILNSTSQDVVTVSKDGVVFEPTEGTYMLEDGQYDLVIDGVGYGYTGTFTVVGATQTVEVTLILDTPTLTGPVGSTDVTGDLYTLTVEPSHDLDVTYEYQWYSEGSDTPISTGSDSLTVTEDGTYYVVVTAVYNGDRSVPAESAHAQVSFYVQEPDADIIRDDQSVSVQAEGDSIIVSSDGEHSGVTVTIDYGGVVMSVEGTFSQGTHTLTLSQTVPAISGYDFGFRIETTTVTVELITVHFDASRDGYDIASVSAYFVNGSSLVPVSSWFEGGMVYFSTTHNSDYVVDVEYEESTVVPPIFDDDDDYVPPIYVPSGSSSSDDDTVKIVACAAAAVVAAIMAAFLILGHRRE